MKKRKKIKRKVGLPSGTYTYLGDNVSAKTKMELIEYDLGECSFKPIKTLDHLNIELHNDVNKKLRWLRVKGLGDTECVSNICKYFNIHPLTIEDVLNTYQRAKIEDYENYIFTVIKNLKITDEFNVDVEQVSIILTPDIIITFYDSEKNIFKEIDDRILNNKGNIRNSLDYLFYVIIDNIVDHYFVIMDEIGEKIEDLYEGLIENTIKDGLAQIKLIQKEMHKIRQGIFPCREVLSRLQKHEFSYISKEMLIYFRDIADHYNQIIELYDANKESLYSMMDVYMSGASNKLNEIMKVLTVISTVFIPLTFIAGVYGMNFRFMPELESKYGYFIVWGVMLLIGTSFGFWFKSKKWL